MNAGRKGSSKFTEYKRLPERKKIFSASKIENGIFCGDQI